MNKFATVIVMGLISALLILSVACTGKKSDLNQEKIDVKASKIKVPIYPDAQEVKFYNIEEVVDGVSYKLELPYEPYMTSDVLKFYDSKMQERGFKPFVEDYYKYADRVWQEYIDGTKKGEPFVAQFSAGWVDDKHTKRARLILKYYWHDHKSSNFIPSNNDDLCVDFQYMPFIVLPPPAKVQ